MTTTELPPGKVVCSRCGGDGTVDVSSREPSNFVVECLRCEGTGYIDDPRIAVWRGDDPAAMIKLLGDGADEAKLRTFCEECCKQYVNSRGRWDEAHHNMTGWEWALSWVHVSQDYFAKEYLRGDSDVRCDLLRCIFPPPYLARERECEACGGVPDVRAIKGDSRYGCRNCHGSGTIPAPLLDPRWLTSTVVDLARTIRGGDGLCCTNECEHEIPPRFDLMPILADALLDAGVPMLGEIDLHCRAGTHVPGCWLLEAILGAR